MAEQAAAPAVVPAEFPPAPELAAGDLPLQAAPPAIPAAAPDVHRAADDVAEQAAKPAAPAAKVAAKASAVPELRYGLSDKEIK